MGSLLAGLGSGVAPQFTVVDCQCLEEGSAMPCDESADEPSMSEVPQTSQPLSRRDFLRSSYVLGAAAIGTAVLGGCAARREGLQKETAAEGMKKEDASVQQTRPPVKALDVILAVSAALFIITPAIGLVIGSEMNTPEGLARRAVARRRKDAQGAKLLFDRAANELARKCYAVYWSHFEVEALKHMQAFINAEPDIEKKIQLHMQMIKIVGGAGQRSHEVAHLLELGKSYAQLGTRDVEALTAFTDALRVIRRYDAYIDNSSDRMDECLSGASQAMDRLFENDWSAYYESTDCGSAEFDSLLGMFETVIDELLNSGTSNKYDSQLQALMARIEKYACFLEEKASSAADYSKHGRDAAIAWKRAANLGMRIYRLCKKEDAEGAPARLGRVIADLERNASIVEEMLRNASQEAAPGLEYELAQILYDIAEVSEESGIVD
ncbi:MAG: hypothetical protein WC600_17760, partial [Desulfobaccales bacterium]